MSHTIKTRQTTMSNTNPHLNRTPSTGNGLFGGIRRRQVLRFLGAGAATLPFASAFSPRAVKAAPGPARRVIFFYFPDGVVGPSQDGQPSLWHPTGGETNFTLTEQLQPLGSLADHCVFFRGLTMGPTDSGSHPGGAQKLLTAVDHGNGESIDQFLARTVGADMPFRHLYLGVMANEGNASGDKHISYPSAGQSITPEDDPRQAFELMFGNWVPGGGGGEAPAPDPTKVTVIDNILDDMNRLRAELGPAEATKLDIHLEALYEVESRIKSPGGGGGNSASCEEPSIDTAGLTSDELYHPERFPDILRAQTDLMILAMACGLTRVGTLQCSHHTSELIMSRFEGSEMHNPGFDMRSHQASHYGASHNPQQAEFVAYLQQRRWWVEQFAYLMQRLQDLPEPEGDGGSMLDHSLVLLCSEVCDGNTHFHDDMPFVLGGGGGGAISTGRLLQYAGRRHADLFVSIAQAMGSDIQNFGDASGGALPGLLG